MTFWTLPSFPAAATAAGWRAGRPGCGAGGSRRDCVGARGARALGAPGTGLLSVLVARLCVRAPARNPPASGPAAPADGVEYFIHVTDGMVHPNDPSFAYGWALQQNPRTLAGIDDAGRTLLVTVGGPQPDQLGLSVPEEARVARALGMREAINLDGGGSTAMSVDGRPVNHPSDASGERSVGDPIVVR